MKTQDIIGDLCGFLTIICGIFLLNAFKEFNISLRNLPSMKKDTSNMSNSNSMAHCNDRDYLLDNSPVESQRNEVMVTDYHDDLEEVH